MPQQLTFTAADMTPEHRVIALVFMVACTALAGAVIDAVRWYYTSAPIASESAGWASLIWLIVFVVSFRTMNRMIRVQYRKTRA